MRSSAPVLSGMPTGKKYMGWWGAFGGPPQVGITQYSLSHYRQNAFQGFLKHSVMQGYSRIIAQVPYFLVPIALSYGVISWAVKKNEWHNSKEGHLAAAESGDH
ncbi:ubiquinol--cytochrome-c reductase subunit 8 [Cystobasidiomycetes sp. EMM_F5]